MLSLSPTNLFPAEYNVILFQMQPGDEAAFLYFIFYSTKIFEQSSLNLIEWNKLFASEIVYDNYFLFSFRGVVTY